MDLLSILNTSCSLKKFIQNLVLSIIKTAIVLEYYVIIVPDYLQFALLSWITLHSNILSPS